MQQTVDVNEEYTTDKIPKRSALKTLKAELHLCTTFRVNNDVGNLGGRNGRAIDFTSFFASRQGGLGRSRSSNLGGSQHPHQE